jgi:hypothetical protein
VKQEVTGADGEALNGIQVVFVKPNEQWLPTGSSKSRISY